MNIKDCISIIKNCTMLSCEYHIKNKCDYSYEVRENRFECAKEQAIQALEKQIPKKPIAEPTDDTCLYYENYCPDCEKMMIVKYMHCPRCGQKLDWRAEF